jgi:hypothetical protein
MQDKAMRLGQALQKKIEQILNGPGTAEEKTAQVGRAQAEYLDEVFRLSRG